MTAEERADMLNKIQNIAEKYGFVVTGYEDSGDLFEVIMMHPKRLKIHAKRMKIHEVEHSQKDNF